jgi:hypothetical protein
MESHLSRRQFGAGLAAVALVGAADAAAETCRLPDWATQLQADLERMARDLNARVQPWQGPPLVVQPEDFGHRPGQRQPATRAIQTAIDSVARRGGGTVRLARGEYVSGTIDFRSNVAQNYLNCEGLLIERLHIENQANFNNDGLDIDGCRRVIVRDCFINSEDDALCFKGASQRPTADVLVENCRLYGQALSARRDAPFVCAPDFLEYAVIHILPRARSVLCGWTADPQERPWRH